MSSALHWLYVVEWSLVRHETSSVSSRLLLIGFDSDHQLCQNEQSASINDASTVQMFQRVQWDGVAFVASVRHVARERAAELPAVVEIALRLLQAQAVLLPMPTMWVCTSGTQPTSIARYPRCAGLWGLARTCRQELESMPSWCIDLDAARGVANMATLVHAASLLHPSGSVRGLQLKATLEPEIALTAANLHVPRLLASHSLRIGIPSVALEAIRNDLTAYILFVKKLSTLIGWRWHSVN